jgi:PEP-CTERM motif
MSSSRLRLQFAVLVFILLPAVSAVVAVHASATCERFVRTYVTRPVKNKVSKTTAEAWAAWRLAHPNWKQNAKNQRPKYVMARDEAVQKMDFACSMPTDPANLDLILKPADFDIPPPVVNLHAMDMTQMDFPGLAPPQVGQMPPQVAQLILPPPPPTPSVATYSAGDVPEPASLLLVGTGFCGVCFLLAAKSRKSALGS